MSGTVEALNRVMARLAEEKLESRLINVSQAFHSPMLDPILDEFEAEVAKTVFGKSSIPVISNVHGGVRTDDEARNPKYWRTHAREVVRYVDGVRTLYDRGIRHFLEIGPHTTASAMAAGCVAEDSALFIASLRRGRDDFDQLFETVSTLYVTGVDIDWAAIHANRPGRRVALPLYPFARVRHWIDGPSGAATSARAESAGHPMLGRAVRSPLIDTPGYEIVSDPSAHRFLRDHRVAGATIFPATGYVEAAREAAVRAPAPASGWAVEDIEITEPLTVEIGSRGARAGRAPVRW